MAVAKKHLAATEDARRLQRLMKYFNVNQSQMARLVSVNPSTVNRALTEGSVSRELKLACYQRLGLSQVYWETIFTTIHGTKANADPDPAKFLSKDKAHERNQAFANAGLPPFEPASAPAADSAAHLDAVSPAWAEHVPPPHVDVAKIDAWRFLLAKLSSERKDPAEVVAALVGADPPPESRDGGAKSVLWLVRRYLELLEQAGLLRRP